MKFIFLSGLGLFKKKLWDLAAVLHPPLAHTQNKKFIKK